MDGIKGWMILSDGLRLMQRCVGAIASQRWVMDVSSYVCNIHQHFNFSIGSNSPVSRAAGCVKLATFFWAGAFRYTLNLVVVSAAADCVIICCLLISAMLISDCASKWNERRESVYVNAARGDVYHFPRLLHEDGECHLRHPFKSSLGDLNTLFHDTCSL